MGCHLKITCTQYCYAIIMNFKTRLLTRMFVWKLFLSTWLYFQYLININDDLDNYIDIIDIWLFKF